MQPSPGLPPQGPRFEELLAQAREGDSDALGQLLQRYRNLLLSVANKMCPEHLRPKAGDSDIVQDVSVLVSKSFSQFRKSTEGQFRAWLIQILIRNVLKFIRAFDKTQQRGGHNEVAINGGEDSKVIDNVPRDPGPSPSAIVASAELFERAMESLSDDDQAVIELRAFGKLEFDEMADVLGCSVEAATRRFHRARGRLSIALASLQAPLP